MLEVKWKVVVTKPLPIFSTVSILVMLEVKWKAAVVIGVVGEFPVSILVMLEVKWKGYCYSTYHH